MKSEKREDDENAPSDYELNVDNAPVENAEKSKKTALRSQGKGLFLKINLLPC